MTADQAEAVRKHRFDVLYSQGTLAALIETIPQSDYLLVGNVAGSPPFQGRGLSRKLMAHAEQGGGIIGSPRKSMRSSLCIPTGDPSARTSKGYAE